MFGVSIVEAVLLRTAVGLGPAVAQPPATAPVEAPAAADPYAEQAPVDVETIMHDTTMAYVHARERLLEHPELALEAVMDRLEAVPAPSPSERMRLLDILASLERPEYVDLFAQQLRRALVDAGERVEVSDAMQRWRPLLLQHGEIAVRPLQSLVGDKDLPIEARLVLLEDMIDLTPPEAIGGLVVLVGRGHTELRQQLRRSLGRRARKDATSRDALLRATDAALDRALAPDPDLQELERLSALLQFRAAIGGGLDDRFVDRLLGVAEDDVAPFSVRVAAIRGLAKVEHPRVPPSLERIARSQLARRDEQKGEILSWLALQALPEAKAAALATEFHLHASKVPRLATLGWALGRVRVDETTLDAVTANPWPQVRQAALGRIEGPCERKLVDRLEKIGAMGRRRSDPDGAVARSAIAALGRCGGKDSTRALVDILEDQEVNVELRAEAARQLARYAGPDGVDAVANVLKEEPSRALARRLAKALGYAPAPTAKSTRILCEQLEEHNEVSRAARDSLIALHPEIENPC